MSLINHLWSSEKTYLSSSVRFGNSQNKKNLNIRCAYFSIFSLPKCSKAKPFQSSILLSTSQSSKYIKKQQRKLKNYLTSQSGCKGPFPMLQVLFVEHSHQNNHKIRMRRKRRQSCHDRNMV